MSALSGMQDLVAQYRAGLAEARRQFIAAAEACDVNDTTRAGEYVDLATAAMRSANDAISEINRRLPAPRAVAS